MTKSNTPQGQKTAYERWEMASFGEETENERRMRKDDEIIKAKAAKLYEDAQQTGYSKGYAKGMQDGFVVGLDNARSEVDEECDTLRAVSSHFQQSLQTMDEQIADDVLSLALDIAQAMTKQAMQHDENAILPIITDAMHYLPTVEKPARLLLNIEDAEVIRKHLGDELQNEGWVIQEESHIESGGCIVETGANRIDATNQIRWKRISEALSKQIPWKR